MRCSTVANFDGKAISRWMKFTLDVDIKDFLQDNFIDR